MRWYLGLSAVNDHEKGLEKESSSRAARYSRIATSVFSNAFR